jgi:hypothetical protein
MGATSFCVAATGRNAVGIRPEHVKTPDVLNAA